MASNSWACAIVVEDEAEGGVEGDVDAAEEEDAGGLDWPVDVDVADAFVGLMECKLTRGLRGRGAAKTIGLTSLLHPPEPDRIRDTVVIKRVKPSTIHFLS